MPNDAVNESAPALREGAFLGREAFRDRIRQAVQQAADEGWRELFFCDVDFEDWPLNERPVIEALGRWVRHAQSFTIVAQRYDKVIRLHPLFTEWRKFWSHKIEGRSCSPRDAQDLPSALWSPHWALQRMDLLRSTGVAGAEAERRAALRETLDECLRRSTVGFPSTTLGL